MKVIIGSLICDKDKVLMVQEGSENRYGLWNFPSGHLENNESIIDGVIRETFEETGYNINVKGVLPIQELYRDNDKYIIIRFVGEIVSYDSNHILDGIIQSKWFNIDDVFKMKKEDVRGYDANIRILNHYLENKVYPIELFEDVYFE